MLVPAVPSYYPSIKMEDLNKLNLEFVDWLDSRFKKKI